MQKKNLKQRYGKFNPRESALESMPEVAEEEEKDQTNPLLNDENFPRPRHTKDSSSHILANRKPAKPPMFSSDVRMKIDENVHMPKQLRESLNFDSVEQRLS